MSGSIKGRIDREYESFVKSRGHVEASKQSLVGDIVSILAFTRNSTEIAAGSVAFGIPGLIVAVIARPRISLLSPAIHYY